jgi:hypothetical protein
MIQVELMGPNDFNHSKLRIGEKIVGFVHAAYIGSMGTFVLISEEGVGINFSIAPLKDCNILDNFISKNWVFELADSSILGIARHPNLRGKIFMKDIFGEISFFIGFAEYNSELFISELYDHDSVNLNVMKMNDGILLTEISQNQPK